MNRSQSLRIPDNVETISHRNSIDNSSIGNMDDIVGIDNRRPHIATAVYKSPSEFDPSESQVLSVIIKEEPFEIDKEWIIQDFNADYNKSLRDWYFTNHSENEVIRLRELFYDFMKENRISLYFFDWYVNYYSKPDKKLCPLTKSTVVWKTSSGSVIESEYPPKETIKIPIGKDLEVEATPYKDSNAKGNIEKRDIKKLHQQLNFTNTILDIMKNQLGRMENMEKVIKVEKPIEKPIYKLQSLDNISLKSKVEAEVEELKEKLRSISLEKLTINTLQKEEELELNKISHKRDYPKTRNYYSRPSPIDVGLEERTQLVQNSFTGSDLIEWNIDGLSEQTILDQMCNMTMAATAYKMRKASDKEAAIMITQGFTGQLKGWWDNFLSIQEKELIINSVKQEDQSPDATSTLIYTIIKNFVGDPSTFKDRIGTQLMNLRCPTMSDYRWYKDVFMSKVMIRDDAHAPFWKERFVVALPKLFSEKVLQKLQTQFGTQIPYNSLTFGQLHNIIVQIGIEVCTDTKIQQKIKQEIITGKRELGTFCYQYGITPEKAPSGQHKIKKRKFYKKPKYNIDKPFYYEQKHYKKFHKTPKEKPKSSNKKKQ
ncbi:hypothetical protein HN51_050411, partial [Arachis hypogaea]